MTGTDVPAILRRQAPVRRSTSATLGSTLRPRLGHGLAAVMSHVILLAAAGAVVLLLVGRDGRPGAERQVR